jgi:alanyl-tRNA synthetase
MTERLYYGDAYACEFQARIVHQADEGRRVYLDRSAFYPTSGGQPHDTGTLNGVAVTDVIDEGERVAHLLSAPIESESVNGAVDWTRRYDFMQQHTGQHLISAILADSFSAPTVSVHFGEAMSTLDVEGTIGGTAVERAEQLANAAVAENRAVQVLFEDAASAGGLRKTITRSGTLRVISIGGLDRSACGGTHVRSTGEIGAVLLRRVEKVRTTSRIEFVCGVRAIARARADFKTLSDLALTLTASPEELPLLVAAQLQERKTAENALRRMATELAGYQARERHALTVPDAAGVRRLVQLTDAGSSEDWRDLAIAWSTLSMSVALFGVRSSRSILLSASVDSGVDAGKTLREAVVAVGGRGGGSARLAQGSVPDDTAFTRAIEALTL